MEKVELGYPMENDDGSIDVPLFFGDYPEEWISWVESYGSDEGFSDLQMMQFAYGFIEGDALAWYCEKTSRSPINNWEEFKSGMLRRFGKNNIPERRNRLSETKPVILGVKQQSSGDSDTKQMGTDTKVIEAETEAQSAESESGFQLSGIMDFVEGFATSKDENMQIGFPQRLEEQLNHEELTTELKQTNVDRAKHACQVFDQMPIRGKGNTKKKKKRWKELSKIFGSVSGFELNGDTYCVEMWARRKDKNMNKYFPQVLEENLNYEAQSDKPKKTCVTMSRNAYQVFGKMIKKKKRKKKKKSFRRQKERNRGFSDQLRRKKKRVYNKFTKFNYIACDLQLEKLLRILKINKFEGHKTGIVRESQKLSCLYRLRIISTYQVADKICPLMLPKEMIKAKREKRRSDMLFLTEWDNKIHQVFLDTLIARIKTVKEKMFWTSGKRHKISDKHAKEKVILFLTFQRKRAFIDPVFRVKKRTRLKLKREFTNSNCVLPVVYVKLLWRFITRVKKQFMTRPKFRKKHSKRKRKKKFVEYKQQVLETVFVVEVAVFHFEIQVKWGKLTCNSIISICLMKDLGDRFVSENTKMYLEKELVKELSQVAYFEREWSFSLGKNIAVAAEAMSTNHNGGNTLEKVSLVSFSRERGTRPTWVGFLTVYGTTIAGICGKKNGLAWDDGSIDRWLKKQSREDQGRCKLKDKEEKGFARSLTTQIPVERAHTARKS